MSTLLEVSGVSVSFDGFKAINNLTFQIGEAELRAVIEKSVVIEKAGERIGVIGLTPINNDELASPGPNIVFTDPSPAVQAEVDKLTADEVNKIILLSHSGYPTDVAIALNTTGVDVIVGGHSNTLLSNTDERAAGPYPDVVNDVAIVQAYAYGKYLGELSVTFDDAGTVIATSGDPVLIDASVEEDAGVKARVSELAQPLEEIRQKVVAEAAEPIGGDRAVCRSQECSMGST